MLPLLSMAVGKIFILNMELLLSYMLLVTDDTEGRNAA